MTNLGTRALLDLGNFACLSWRLWIQHTFCLSADLPTQFVYHLIL